MNASFIVRLFDFILLLKMNFGLYYMIKIVNESHIPHQIVCQFIILVKTMHYLEVIACMIFIFLGFYITSVVI